jgi:hypothetical protein
MVLAERLLPFGDWVARLLGAAAILAGIEFLLR